MMMKLLGTRFLLLLWLVLPARWSWTSWAWIPSTPPSARRYDCRSCYSTTRLYMSSSPMEYQSAGLNELHTLLRDAVQQQDYGRAGQISDEVLKRLFPEDDSSVDKEEMRLRRRQLSWRGLGAAPWLSDRLDALNYTFPTTIQINALQAVNAILNTTRGLTEDGGPLTLQERIDASRHAVGDDLGLVVSGTTGSGKTLAYLVPMLSTLSDSLFARQRLRVGAEEMVDVGDTTDDLLDRVAVVTAPTIRSSDGKTRTTTKKGAIATGASLSTLGASGKDVKSPLALIVVPTRELGVQTALLLYQLIGGTIDQQEFGGTGGDADDNDLLQQQPHLYKGPKGIRIACVLDDEEAKYGLKLQTDVAITMPEYLGKLLQDGDLIPSKLRVVIFDEADLCLEDTKAEDLTMLFDDDPDEREYNPRLAFLVGASVTEALGRTAVRSRLLPPGKSYIASATRFAALTGSDESPTPSKQQDSSGIVGTESKTASLQDLDICLHPGLSHERAIVKPGKSGLLVLTRLLRKELEEFDKTKKYQRPRVVVFFPNEEEARKAIEPLRDALWGEHRLCVLLPKTGVSPLTIMDQFRKNETTVMLATANSVRGLDFPALTHVYTLYLPMDDAREYIHLAGRVGRVGQLGSALGGGGHVVSIVDEKDAEQMDQLAATLGFSFTDIDSDPDVLPRASQQMAASELEEARRSLEDTISLLDLAEDVDDVDSIDVAAEVVDDSDEESFQ